VARQLKPYSKKKQLKKLSIPDINVSENLTHPWFPIFEKLGRRQSTVLRLIGSLYAGYIVLVFKNYIIFY